MAPAAATNGSDSIKPRDVCIVGVARTPLGGFLGSLSSLPATKLGSIAIESALKRANVDPSLVQEVYFGNVLGANLGQGPARQAALGAGIPNTVVSTTINKVCASGMKATMLAAQSIQLGINDVVVAGGMESMSNVPKYIADARKGSKFGHDTLVDGMVKDGLWDAFNDFKMGNCGEICADMHELTREQQDDYAIQSFERGIAARDSGAFAWEIVPVEVPGPRGRPSTIVDKDEDLGKFDPAKLRKLRPAFKENGGSVTAGNSSGINDGAAALVLVSGEKALELGLKVIAKVSGYADAEQAPELFTTSPSLAIPKAISRAGLEASQIDYYEINEAFAAVALSNQKLLNLDPAKLNVHGGGVSLGHPLGCSGARIIVTLLGVLRQKSGKYGAAGVCNGGGAMMAKTKEGPCEEEDVHMGSLRILNAINAKRDINARKESSRVEAKNKGKARTKSKAEANGLRFVSTIINEISTRAVVDTRATHNFISIDEAKRLELETMEDSGWIKATNKDAKPISGVARDAKAEIMEWEGELDLSVVPIDDYKLVVRVEFFNKRGTKSKAKMIFAMQLESCFKELKQNTSDISSDVEKSRDTKGVLEEVRGTISSVLPPQRIVYDTPKEYLLLEGKECSIDCSVEIFPHREKKEEFKSIRSYLFYADLGDIAYPNARRSLGGEEDDATGMVDVDMTRGGEEDAGYIIHVTGGIVMGHDIDDDVAMTMTSGQDDAIAMGRGGDDVLGLKM
nr:acetyl-CoA acetyltransferase, cytosolic 1-like [Tanacetum cinerariifolium]